MTTSGSITSENNTLINLTVNTNNQYVKHDKVKYVTILAIYTAKQSLTTECHILPLTQFRDCTAYTVLPDAQYLK